MALMLHQLGWNARVVIGAYPSGESADASTLVGTDMHVWVEMEFEAIGWAVFDPTPDKDRVPQDNSEKKKNSPRPQVLQPPEPPEEPVELPPVNRDQDVAAKEPPGAGIPWLLIGTVSGSLLLLLAPFALIAALKARRTRVRRKASPGVALVGSWDEVVDMAIDAGVRVRADQTRQEAAWALASFWKLREGQEEGAEAQRVASQASTSALIPGWTLFRERVPMTVAIARRADVADFAAATGGQKEAESAWSDVDQLKRSLASSASLWVRLRRRFSLRSLLRTWRRPPAAGKESVRGVGSLLEDGEDADGPLENPSSGRSRP